MMIKCPGYVCIISIYTLKHGRFPAFLNNCFCRTPHKIFICGYQIKIFIDFQQGRLVRAYPAHLNYIERCGVFHIKIKAHVIQTSSC